MKTTSTLFMTVVALALFSGCAKNPAEDVAEAKVENASPAEPATPAPDAPDTVEAKKYKFAEGSTIEFTGSKVTGSHSGGFKKFDGYFTVAGDALGGGDHKVEIDMKSTFADHPKLEKHLKSADFFDVETYPKSVFTLNSIEKGEADNYTLSGELTLHGVTKKIAFPAEITGDATQFNLRSEFSIKRFDFDIKYPGMADDLIRDEVVIKLDLKAVPG